MTRKDYINFANRLSDAYPVDVCGTQQKAAIEQWEIDCSLIADACQADNPRFDRSRFLEACRPKGVA